MNPHLSDDAAEFGEVAAKAFASAGGVDVARRAEADPSVRSTEAGPLLDRLGIGDLDAAADLDSAEAAAALCREAGRVVLPYPLVPALLASAGAPLTLRSRRNDRRFPTPDESSPRAGRSRRNERRIPTADESSSRVDHADVFDRWRLATNDGDTASGVPGGDLLGTRLGPFVGTVVADDDPVSITPAEIALYLTLTGFVIAGGLSAAVDLATAHVVDRVQFDQPLSKFQAVQFQLADAHVAVAGVDEMVQFALWRCHAAPDAAIADALGARLAALDAARAVLRITQQLHGASGMCDEYDVSVIARHLQPALRIPFGAETTAGHLADAVERVGFEGLFDHGGVGS